MARFTEGQYSRRSVVRAAIGAAALVPAAAASNAAGAESRSAAQAAGAGGDDAGKNGKLCVAVIPASWPDRTGEEVFRISARLGFEAVQCEMGIDAGWLRSHPPHGPEKGPWLEKRIASSELRGAQFHLAPDRPDETVRRDQGTAQQASRRDRLPVHRLPSPLAGRTGAGRGVAQVRSAARRSSWTAAPPVRSEERCSATVRATASGSMSHAAGFGKPWRRCGCTTCD